MPASPPTLRTRATHHGLAAVVLMLLAAAWFGGAAPVRATSTAEAMDAQILLSINQARAGLHLQPLRLDARLISWANQRSAWMAARNVLTHTSFDGSPCNLYDVMRISWYQCGEDIADTTAVPGAVGAAALYSLWKNSPEHYALITSNTFNYIGIGVTYRPANRTTYASILFLEGPDRTMPIESWTIVSLIGRTVHWGWTAYDPILQTHLAGVLNYDVELRVNNGAWGRLRTASLPVSCTMPNRVRGSTWALRVRARDAAGNVSHWLTSATITIH